MVNKQQTLSIDELGQLAGLLLRYEKELQYEAADGAMLDECQTDQEKRHQAIVTIHEASKTVNADLNWQLNNY